jgi:hypothetical protein
MAIGDRNHAGAGRAAVPDSRRQSSGGRARLDDALAPVCWLLVLVLHRLRPGWLSSVQARIRWRYLLVCLAVLIGGQLAVRPMAAREPEPAMCVDRLAWS